MRSLTVLSGSSLFARSKRLVKSAKVSPIEPPCQERSKLTDSVPRVKFEIRPPFPVIGVPLSDTEIVSVRSSNRNTPALALVAKAKAGITSKSNRILIVKFLVECSLVSAGISDMDPAAHPPVSSVALPDAVDGSPSREVGPEFAPFRLNILAPAAPSGDTPAGSPPAPHHARSGYGAPAQVGCHASRSMRPRICPNSRCKWLSASWRMKYRACRMSRPPVLNSRCWRLVRDQL